MATSTREQKQSLGDCYCPVFRWITRPSGFVLPDLQSKALLSSRCLQLHLRLHILSDAFGIFLRWSLILRLSAVHSS